MDSERPPSQPARAVAHRGHLFSADEWAGLCALQARYRRDTDVLSDQERRRLAFFVWMYGVGWLPS